MRSGSTPRRCATTNVHGTGRRNVERHGVREAVAERRSIAGDEHGVRAGDDRRGGALRRAHAT